jgi:hypothetical protein
MSKAKTKPARLIFAASETDPDMLYSIVIPSEVEESLTTDYEQN